MVEKAAPQVHVLRLGAAAQKAGETRVRWVYAIQCLDEEALREQFAILADAQGLGPQELQDMLAKLPVNKVLAGAGEIQAAARRDPMLRRALRAARDTLRGEDAEALSAKIASEQDKGAV